MGNVDLTYTLSLSQEDITKYKIDFDNYISKNRIWQEFFYVFYYNFSYFPVISPFRHTQNSTGA